MNPENNIPMQPLQPVEEKTIGPAIGVIIIILVLVLGGLYFWGERMNKGREMPNPQLEEPAVTDAQTTELQIQSSSDDTNAIDADLTATDLSNLGTETAEMNATASSSASN
jgi:hypothetical protein